MPTREEVLAVIDSIGTCENETERRTMLDGLRDNVNSVYAERDGLTATNKKLTEDNEKLRSANTDIWLELGAQKSKPGEPEPGEPQPKNDLTIDNLFNEKGELK